MGILGDIVDGVGDVIGDVVGGVVDVVDDVFGVDLGKVLNNKYVKGALLAASIFTGGVAIVNGVMQGFNAATAATGFMNKFVAGASGFAKGVAAGLANPLDTAGNIIGGDPSVAAKLVAPGQQEALRNTPTDLLANADVGKGSIDAALGGAEGSLQIPGSPVPVPQSSNLNMPNFDASVAPKSFGSDILSAGGEAAKSAGGEATRSAAQNFGTGDFLSNLAKGAGKFASSPAGMQTISSGISGYAQARMLEKREKREMEQERARRDSYSGFGDRAPRKFDVPGLRDLRRRTQELNQRGDAANAQYGY